MPQTLIRIFPQAISKTASCVTSQTLHFTYTLNPFSPRAVFPGHFRTFSWRVCSSQRTKLKKKASMNHCAEISGGSKRESREAANCFCKSQLCLSLPALEHWACKSFSCEGLGPASIGTVSKEHCLFQKTEGTSLRGECWLFALSPATLSLLSALLLSALGVIPARAGSVVCSGIRGSLDRSWKGRSVSQTPRE